jgi:manganese/zinc/iron transport system permease protein
MDAELYYVLMLLLTGGLVAVSCALTGTFLVLRRMSLVGDAISHAVLPGIGLGFALTYSRHSLVMLIGATAAGLATVWLIELLHRSRRVYEDAAIAIVFPALFALGVVVIDQFPYTDLDTDCVFQGDLSSVPDRSLVIAGVLLGPQAVWILGAAALINLSLVLVFYKELKLTTFDPALAESLGFAPRRMHYLLMTAVSITTVAAFESVGAILVVSFLIVPAATAYLTTNHLSRMLLAAVGFGLLATLSGYLVARPEVLDCNPAGAMAMMSGFWFGVVWLTSPRYGLLATLRRRRKLAHRFAADLLLIHLQKVGTLQEASALSHERFGWSRGFGRRILSDLERRGLLRNDHGELGLTPQGAATVLELERGYRP